MTTKPLKRQGRIHRDPKFVKKIYPLEDIWMGQETLVTLAQFRLLTNLQIAEMLHRDTMTPTGTWRTDAKAYRVANQSLDRLMNANLITRTPVTLQHRTTRNKYMTHLNLLTGAGAKLVQEWYTEAGLGQAVRWSSNLRSEFKDSQPNHLVAINDCLIHAHRAFWSVGCEIVLCLDDASLKRHFKGMGFVPDFLIIVKTPTGRHGVFFGEVDRATMTGDSNSPLVRDWVSKIQTYGAFLRGAWRELPLLSDLGLDPRDMAHPLVLCITQGDGRLRNLRNATHKAGGGNAYWHTTLESIYDNPKLGINNWLAMQNSIWFRPSMGSEPVSLLNHLELIPRTTP